VSGFPPERMSFRARHIGASATSLVSLYGPRLHEMTQFSVTGMNAPEKGTLASLTARIGDGDGITGVTIRGKDHLRAIIGEHDEHGTWEVQIDRGEMISESWLARLVGILRDAPTFPGLQSAVVERQQSSLSSFVPEPPLAGANHALLTTDARVAESYDDPAAFWRMWKVEPIGSWKVCTRALSDIDEIDWLARTFESTMALVRAAKPRLTKYGPAYWEPEMRTWWEFGDYHDEKGGFPALAPGDYDEATHTYDMIGFITKTPLQKGGEERRHVLVREIHYVRDMVRGKRDPAGRPVEAVRITFLEEWMARQERRPLLDAGARVYFRGNKTGELIEIKD
jgi:hypothetical protein